MPNLRFVAHALAHFESGLEHAVQHRPRFAVVERDLIGVAHLAQDFRFAQQHGIEPGRHAKQMAHGVAVPMAVQRAVQFAERKLVEGGEEEFHGAGAIRGKFARHAVEFTAIAGRKDQRFFEDAA